MIPGVDLIPEMSWYQKGVCTRSEAMPERGRYQKEVGHLGPQPFAQCPGGKSLVISRSRRH
jgi:hypothetical protein